jgi:hypothetical protein
MPGAVVNAGLADSVTPLAGVVPEILKRIGPAYFFSRPAEAKRSLRT